MRPALVLLLLAAAGVGCGDGGAAAPSSQAVVPPAGSAAVPESGPVEVIDGLDGRAFMTALEPEGFACGEPVPFTSALQQWNCSAQAAGVDGVAYEVVILGESLSAVHSIDASVDQFATDQADRTIAARFLSFIAGIAAFSGADTSAAAVWVSDNRLTAVSELEVAGVTYNLRGPAELRALEIVATD